MGMPHQLKFSCCAKRPSPLKLGLDGLVSASVSVSARFFRYLGVMQGALVTNQKGTEHRLAALEQVQALLTRLDAVSQAYDALKVGGVILLVLPCGHAHALHARGE